ncbi:MAG: glucose-6-phosphate isomerase [Dehalococcoidia bacterium]
MTDASHGIAPQAAGTRLGPIEAAVATRLETMANDRAIPRTWEHDHTLWQPDPTEITDRLGWLDVLDEMRPQLDDLRGFAREVHEAGFETVVLLGMGGSSLAPEVFYSTFGRGPNGLDLIVLDATDPEQVREVEAAITLERTVFIVASKSGSTIETLSHLDHFWSLVPRGEQFIAITDPGSGLAKLASERGFRRTFLNRSTIGGRYAALSFFGLVPAALIGADLEALTAAAHSMQEACRTEDPASNPGVWLGAVLGEGALAGRDQVTLVLPEAIDTLGYWIEQLIAESTGKHGLGILPIEGEPLGALEVYGERRLFVAIGDIEEARLGPLAEAGHPVVRLPFTDALQLGVEFFRWEFATAIAGQILGINAFDQPNVQEAKDATNAVLAGDEVDPSTPPARDVLAQVVPGEDYLAILAYVPRNEETKRRLQAARVALRDRYRVATTVGFGPRFLHSTGQLHKGGPNNGVFLQIVDADPNDIDVPGRSFTFGRLKQAQALGDLASLRAHGRRVARLSLDELEALAGG